MDTEKGVMALIDAGAPPIDILATANPLGVAKVVYNFDLKLDYTEALKAYGNAEIQVYIAEVRAPNSVDADPDQAGPAIDESTASDEMRLLFAASQEARVKYQRASGALALKKEFMRHGKNVIRAGAIAGAAAAAALTFWAIHKTADANIAADRRAATSSEQLSGDIRGEDITQAIVAGLGGVGGLAGGWALGRGGAPFVVRASARQEKLDQEENPLEPAE